MKQRKVIDYVAVALGAFAFIAYISYFIKLIIWPEGAFPLVICIAVMSLSALPVIFHRQLASFLPVGIFTALKYIYLIAAAFYAVTFLALTVYIYATLGTQVTAEEVTDDSVIIVYGAGLKQDGTPDKALAKRLNKALELSEGNSCRVIVSGRQGYDEPCTEAFAMKKYLTEKGLSEERIILEERAADTKENVRFSYEIIKEMGDDVDMIVSVSNKFHVPRIRLLCALNGFDSQVSAADDPAGMTVFASLVREYMSYVKLIITGHD